jgi:adenosylcobyric acid synthase
MPASPRRLKDRRWCEPSSAVRRMASRKRVWPARVLAMAALMVQGTSSGAGKSVLTAAICASLHRRGVRVAPFKAQNMSNNARVVDGGEIGAAQWFQALAAGVGPHVDHNPVLLKPEADTRSQVIVLGQVDRHLTDMPWRDRSSHLWDVIAGAYDRVAGSTDVVVLEGAGSPAEINLVDVDLVNHRIAHHADASILLVSDIDRGGSFAHLYGTWALVGDELQRRISGFVLNKFRGDAALLEPGPSMLFERTGVPVIGVVPMVDHGLPDEDGADPRPTTNGPLRVRVVRGPAASNLDEWWPLREVTSFAWATEPGDLVDADLVVLPGSKLIAADLAWARHTGMDAAVHAAHQRGTLMLAVCGGVQFLGGAVNDPHRVEQATVGLGITSGTTVFDATKTVRHADCRFATGLPAPWAALSGQPLSGYEVRYGRTEFASNAVVAIGDGLGFVEGNVLAVYVHGMVENSNILYALTGRQPARPLHAVFDGLADLVDEHLDLSRHF